jgi:RNA polymerase sigma-70 factor, ECF subfamily
VSTPAAGSRREELERALAAEGNRLYALALRVTRDADLAADALHDGFASAIENIGDFRDESALATWLYRIVYRKAIDQLRRRGREQPMENEDELRADDERLERTSAWARPPDEILLGAESREALEQALAELTPVQRAVFELREVEQRPTEEVAEILGIPPGTVRVYVHRARLRLRALLAPHFRPRDPEATAKEKRP